MARQVFGEVRLQAPAQERTQRIELGASNERNKSGPSVKSLRRTRPIDFTPVRFVGDSSANARRGRHCLGNQPAHASTYFSPRDVMRNNAPGSDWDGRPNSHPVASPVATHWTRILDCDLLASRSTDSSAEQGERAAADRLSSTTKVITTRGHEDKEVSVKTTDSRRDAGSDRRGTSIQAGAILLTICILTYLAIAGILHVMSLEAAAAAPDSTPPSMSAATASNSPVGVAQAVPSNALDQDSEPATSTRECGQKAYDDRPD